MRHGPLRLSILAVPLGLALTACSPAAQDDDAAKVAGRFVSAVADRDGTTACTLLTEQARESVIGATDAKCGDAVLNVQEQGTALHRVQVWGDAAQVRIGSDVVFLMHLRSGWFISAAGCTPQTAAPYKCDVDG